MSIVPAASVLGRRWAVPAAGPESGELAAALKVSPIVAQLLWHRGFRSPEEAHGFLEPRLQSLGDPFALTDLAKAAGAIAQAVDARQRIVIFGDYDVDGVTSCALLWRILRRLGADVRTFLPHRMEEGYGLSRDGVERCLEENRPDLLVAVDCGTTSVEQIAWVREQGVGVVVIDHHELPPALPVCEALVNPHRDGRWTYLASVGLVFKVCHGLLKVKPEAKAKVDLRDFMDLVAVGTVADIVPLVEENRVLVRRGLQQLAQSLNPGLRALCQVTRLQGVPTASDVGFRIGPRLNASGRLGDASRSLRLLQTDDPAEAMALARELDARNRERQSLEQRTLEEAVRALASCFVPERDAVMVLAGRGWHVGVIGIVASRLQRLHHRPAVVIGIDEATGIGKGSCRSIEGCSIIEALRLAGEYLEAYGGHEMAAGLTIREAAVEAFRAALNARVDALLPAEARVPRLELSGVLDASDVGEELYRELTQLAPFGRNNPEPVFLVREARFARPARPFGTNHFKLFLHGADGECEAVAFGLADRPLPRDGCWLAGALGWNDYTGGVQVRIVDWCDKPAAA